MTERHRPSTESITLQDVAARSTGRAVSLGILGRYLLRRLVRLLISVGVVIVAAFALIHLIPGDPVRAALGVSASTELVAARRAQLGLNDPLPLQFWNYLSGLVHGDLGSSIVSQLPVADAIAQRFPTTVLLALLAFAIVILIGMPAGLIAGIVTFRGRRPVAEAGFSATTGFAIALPEFLVAVSMILVFGVTLGIAPVAGAASPAHYVLPVITLALAPTAYLARIVRVETLAALDHDYIRTARAKRLPPAVLYARHALPNMVTASLTTSGMTLTGLIAGTVVVETIFAMPGMGSTIVGAIIGKDYPTVQGIVLVYAVLVLFVNLLVDLLLVAIDPRSTLSEG